MLSPSPFVRQVYVLAESVCRHVVDKAQKRNLSVNRVIVRGREAIGRMFTDWASDPTLNKYLCEELRRFRWMLSADQIKTIDKHLEDLILQARGALLSKPMITDEPAKDCTTLVQTDERKRPSSSSSSRLKPFLTATKKPVLKPSRKQERRNHTQSRIQVSSPISCD